jgi:hypothetical protein
VILIEEVSDAVAPEIAGEELAHDLCEAAQRFVQHGLVEGFFRREVIEDGGLVRVRGRGDLLDRDAAESTLGEELSCGVDDGAAAIGTARGSFLTDWRCLYDHMVSI